MKTRIAAIAMAVVLACTAVISGCTNIGGDITPAETTTTPSQTEKNNENEEKAQERIDALKGVVISKVYGNGGEVDGACKYSFIELYNSTDADVSLSNAAIYYKGDNTPIYKEFDFGDAVIKAGSTLLIRGESCENDKKQYDETNEILRVDNFDLEWEITVDNKEFSMILSAKGLTLDSSVQAAEETKKASYLVATESYYFDTGYVNDSSKNKLIVRTELREDSGYYLVNLLKANSAKLRQVVPSSSTTANTVVKSMLTEITFSKDAGFYSEAITIELSAPDGYNVIYYTTDGSDPSDTTSKRKRYRSPIELADSSTLGYGKTTETAISVIGSRMAPSSSTLPGGYVIKACATNGTEYTPVYTNTYFVSSLFSNYGVTVMSLSMSTDELFGNPGFYVNYSPSSNDPNTRGTGIMEVFDSDGSRRGYSAVELSISGHGSSGWSMKSMKIYYKDANNDTGGLEGELNYDIFGGNAVNSKGQTITEYSRILLRNSGNDCATTYIRDAYMQRICSKLEVDTMASKTVMLFINGECWGIYNVRERYSDDYFEQHYGIDGDNIAILESDYSQVHTNCNADFIVSAGVDGDEVSFNQLVKYMKSHDLAQQSYYEHVTSLMDTTSFINMFISRIYYNALDWPENNIKVWRNRNPEDPSGFDTKWHFTLLDLDFGISFYNGGGVDTTETANIFDRCYSTGCVIGNMMTALLRNESFKKEFMLRFYEALNEVFVADEMVAILEEMVDERANVFQIQVDRWPGDGANWSSYNNGVARMKKFAKNRYSYALKYLCSFFGVTEAELKAMTGNYITATVLSSRITATVDGTQIDSSWQLKFEGEKTFTVEASPINENIQVEAIIFTDTNGVETRVEGSKATFTTSIGGKITFETKRIKTDTAAGTVQSGITAGAASMFYLTSDGDLYAWGNNANNMLGAGSANTVVTKPTLVMENVAKVETCHSNDAENGNYNVMTAVLTTSGELFTIGYNSSGDIARDGDPYSWGQVSFDGEIADISVGYDHLLVLDKNGTLWGIGGNAYGQLGSENLGGQIDHFIKIATNVAQISAGRRNTAFIDKNGDCYIMGDARWNKFSDSTDPITSPYKLLSNVTYITSGEHELLMVTESGALYYAGWRTIEGFTQGTGTYGAKLLMNGNVQKAAIHHGDIIILTETGGTYVYGINNSNCILKNVSSGTPSSWIKSDIVDVAAGYAFTAMLKSDGTILITGDNSFGEAGNGSASGTVELSTVKIS